MVLLVLFDGHRFLLPLACYEPLVLVVSGPRIPWMDGVEPTSRVERSSENEKQASPTSAQCSLSKQSGCGDTAPETSHASTARCSTRNQTCSTTTSRPYPSSCSCVRSQAIARAFLWVPFARRAGRTLSCFPSSKTTNEEWANRQQRKTLPARFSV